MKPKTKPKAAKSAVKKPVAKNELSKLADLSDAIGKLAAEKRKEAKLSRNLTKPGTDMSKAADAAPRKTLERLVERLYDRLDLLVHAHVKGMATFSELLESLPGLGDALRTKHLDDGSLDDSFGPEGGKIIKELNHYLFTHQQLRLQRKVL